MPMWLFIIVIGAAAVIGSCTGTIVALSIWLYRLNKPKRSRQHR